MNEQFKKNLVTFASLIKNSKHLVVFTGSGIRTESGIHGLKRVWWSLDKKDKGLAPKKLKIKWEDVEPNLGHYALIELKNLGKLKNLISQNVDNLHLKSGIHPEKIAELHGNSTLMKCLNCNKKFKKKKIWNEKKWAEGYLTNKEIKGSPRCDCGGRIIS